MDAPLSRELHSLLLLTLVAKPNLQKNRFLEIRNSMLRNTSIADQHLPLRRSFSGQVSLRLQRFSLHWVLAEKITLLIIFCKKNIDEYLFI